MTVAYLTARRTQPFAVGGIGGPSSSSEPAKIAEMSTDRCHMSTRHRSKGTLPASRGPLFDPPRDGTFMPGGATSVFAGGPPPDAPEIPRLLGSYVDGELVEG